jgi:hypothetical protein
MDYVNDNNLGILAQDLTRLQKFPGILRDSLSLLCCVTLLDFAGMDC